MKQIYALTLVFLPFWVFSQLHIQPHKEQDSYLYVEGPVLYVEKQINLHLNPSSQLKASIYLRNESQLIQGDENTVNTGDGLLSVFQEGKASAFTYNYWGSPVENVGNNSMFGNIINEPLGKTNSTPALITQEHDGSARPLKISNRWVYKLSGQQYADWEYAGHTFNLLPGEGFTMKGVKGTNTDIVLYGVANNPGNEQRYDFRGRPYTGTLGLDIRQDEILLVGNPYPSAIDLNEFLQENINTTGIAYFWDSRNISSHYLKDYEGGYGAYSPIFENEGYVPPVFSAFDNFGQPTHNTGESGYNYARRFSPVAQGFVVEGFKNGKVLFKNRYREFVKENPQTSQFKSSYSIQKSSTSFPYARFNIQLNKEYVRQLMLAIHPDATPGIDRAMDAKNIMPLESDAGWLIDDNNYLINAIAWDENAKIPFFITIAKETEVNFSLAEVNNIQPALYLYDDHSGLYYNLLNQEIKFILPPGEYKDRFFIKFYDLEEESAQLLEVRENQFRIFQNNLLQRTEILTPPEIAPQHIALFDISGKRIYGIPGSTNQPYYEIPTGSLSKGVYIIKINSIDGTVITKKVIIFN